MRDRGLPSPELPPHVVRETPEGERRSFEIRNAAGDLICGVEAIFSPAEVPLELTEWLRRNNADGMAFSAVTDVAFLPPTGGERIPFSALCPVEGVRVLVPAKRLENYCASQSEEPEGAQTKFVVVPSPESALDVGVWLHEFGHLAQGQEEEYRHYKQKDSVKDALRRVERLFSAHAFEEIIDLLRQTPGLEASPILPAGERQHLQSFLERKRALKEREEALREEGKEIQDKIDKVQWAFLRQYKTRGGEEGILPESIFLDEAEWDDRGNVVLEPTRHEIDEAERQGLIQDIVTRIPSDVGERSISLEWHPEEAAVFAHISFTPGQVRFGCRMRLEADKHAFTDLQDSVRQLQMRTDERKEERSRIGEEDNLLREEIRQFLGTHQQTIIDELWRPTRILERDATRRALVWLRAFKRQTGVDFTQDLHDETSFSEVQCDLRDALATYGADSKSMQKGKHRSPRLTQKQKT